MLRFFFSFISLVIISHHSAFAVAASSPFCIRSYVNENGTISIKWKIGPKVLKTGDTLQILTRSISNKLTSIKALKAKSAGSWRGKIHSLSEIEYRILLVQKKGRVKYSRRILLSSLRKENIALKSTNDDHEVKEQSAEPSIAQFSCPNNVEEVLLSLINNYRSSLGLNLLSPNNLLSQAAAVHTKFMAEQSLLSHNDWTQEILNTGYHPLFAAQNTGMSTELDPHNLFQEWLNSPGHRASLEAATAKEAGLFCVLDTHGFYWWTLNLGTSF